MKYTHRGIFRQFRFYSTVDCQFAMGSVTRVILMCVVAFEAFIGGIYAAQTNMCPFYDKVRNGFTNISRALDGLNITAGVNSNTQNFLMSYDSTGQPISGLIYDILAEVGQRGGFKVLYEVIRTPKGLTLTQQLQYNLPRVDIMASKYFIDSTARRAVGIGFTYGSIVASVQFTETNLSPLARCLRALWMHL